MYAIEGSHRTTSWVSRMNQESICPECVNRVIVIDASVPNSSIHMCGCSRHQDDFAFKEHPVIDLHVLPFRAAHDERSNKLAQYLRIYALKQITLGQLVDIEDKVVSRPMGLAFL